MPVVSIQTPILDGLGQVLGGDAIGVIEVRNRPRDFQNAIMRAGAEAHSTNRHFERTLAGVVKRAQFPELRYRDLRVVKAAGLLQRSSLSHAPAHFG